MNGVPYSINFDKSCADTSKVQFIPGHEGYDPSSTDLESVILPIELMTYEMRQIHRLVSVLNT